MSGVLIHVKVTAAAANIMMPVTLPQSSESDHVERERRRAGYATFCRSTCFALALPTQTQTPFVPLLSHPTAHTFLLVIYNHPSYFGFGFGVWVSHLYEPQVTPNVLSKCKESKAAKQLMSLLVGGEYMPRQCSLAAYNTM